jgi:CRP-like cAMP-binding protein
MARSSHNPQGFIVEGANRVWESILHLGEKRRYAARQRVTLPLSESEQGVFYLKRGSVRLAFVSEYGDEMIQLIIKAGTTFNEISALTPVDSSSLEFYCLEAVEAYFFHRAVIFCPDFVRGHPELILNLMESMTRKSSLFFNHGCELGMFNSFRNICRTLYFLWERQGKSAEFAPGLTHGDLAAHLGIHRASLHKILRRLIDEGVIGGYTSRKLTILDPARLEIYALRGEGGAN